MEIVILERPKALPRRLLSPTMPPPGCQTNIDNYRPVPKPRKTLTEVAGAPPIPKPRPMPTKRKPHFIDEDSSGDDTRENQPNKPSVLESWSKIYPGSAKPLDTYNSLPDQTVIHHDIRETHQSNSLRPTRPKYKKMKVDEGPFSSPVLRCTIL